MCGVTRLPKDTGRRCRIRMAPAEQPKPKQPEGDQEPARDLGPVFHHCLDLDCQPGGIRDPEVEQEALTEQVQQEGEDQQREADADQTLNDSAARTVVNTVPGTPGNATGYRHEAYERREEHGQVERKPVRNVVVQTHRLVHRQEGQQPGQYGGHRARRTHACGYEPRRNCGRGNGNVTDSPEHAAIGPGAERSDSLVEESVVDELRS